MGARVLNVGEGMTLDRELHIVGMYKNRNKIKTNQTMSMDKPESDVEGIGGTSKSPSEGILGGHPRDVSWWSNDVTPNS